ncbi:MAG: 3-oxoacid CoA-transferase subunit A [Dehalococcoidales bacterium]|nr:3-oxoacid CoA-transferase subunit A [Dehalococcoidales bacterium]
MVDKVSTVTEALAGVKDGSLIAMNLWSAGGSYYLLQALKNHEAKDLTLYVHNYVLRPDALMAQGLLDAAFLLPKVKKIISAFSNAQSDLVSASKEITRRVKEGTLEFENMSYGMFVERLVAGAMRLGGVYSPVGPGTNLEKGKEKRTINGVEYIFVEPVIPDVGFIHAAKADRLGNLVYHGTSRTTNPIIAMASKYTVAEVLEIVEPGELNPDAIVTPGIFVDKIVRVPDDDITRTKRTRHMLLSIKHRRELEAAKGVMP